MGTLLLLYSSQDFLIGRRFAPPSGERSYDADTQALGAVHRRDIARSATPFPPTVVCRELSGLEILGPRSEKPRVNWYTDQSLRIHVPNRPPLDVESLRLMMMMMMSARRLQRPSSAPHSMRTRCNHRLGSYSTAWLVRSPRFRMYMYGSGAHENCAGLRAIMMHNTRYRGPSWIPA